MSPYDLIPPETECRLAAQAAAEQAEYEGIEPGATWPYLWPATTRFSAEFADCVPCSGKRVIDLGCGRGLLGMSALCAGAAHVTFADGAPALIPLLDAAIVQHGFQQRANTFLHPWNAALPPCDLLLGGDILYRADWYNDLCTIIAGSIGSQGIAYLVDPRRQFEPALNHAMQAAQLRYDIEWRENYSLVTARRATKP